MVNYFLLSSLRVWDCMNTLITSPRYSSICISGCFSEWNTIAFLPTWARTYSTSNCAPWNTAARGQENQVNTAKPTDSLSSARQRGCYSGIIPFPLESIKVISVREQEVRLIDRSPEWGFEIRSCRGQGRMVIILPAVAATELTSTFNHRG